MEKLILKFLFLIVLLFGSIQPSYAFDQYESMKVGETKTFHFPSEVTSRASSMYSYNCTSDHINNVEIVNYTNTSVTVKAIAYTSATVNIRFDYWWYENSYGRNDTHMVHIDLNDSGYSGSSSENPWDYTFDYGSWGTVDIEVGQTKTFYSSINPPNPDKLVSVIWSDYNQFGYEIISQSRSSCTIKGTGAISGQKLWCLWKYGNSTYKNYYTINIVPSTKETLSLSAEPNGGKVSKGTKVYLSASKPGSTIYYTTNGNNPTTSSNTYSSSGITINNSCTLRAFARKSGCNDSPVMTWLFTVEEPVSVTNITLGPTSASLYTNAPGNTVQLTATVYPSDATDKSVTWSSSNNNVAIVNNAGLVTAKAEGYTIITCKANDGSGVSEACNITVTEHAVAEINETNFPDENFRNWILAQDYGKDGKLTETEIKSIGHIDVSGTSDNPGSIENLKGIEYFTSLTILECYNNKLISLDMSKNTALIYLACYNNKLTSLDVSKSPLLKSLYCYNNQLQILDVSGNTALDVLSCRTNQLIHLDVSKNTILTSLYCQENQLKSIDVSRNAELAYLSCRDNQLAVLDVTKNMKLLELSCDNNHLTFIDLSKNTALTELYCPSNQLTSLDVSKNATLTYLDCGGNQLTSLDVSKNTALRYLYCYSNQLTSLDVSKNTALTTLSCGDNQLTYLDVSKNTALTRLYCSRNQIKGASMDALIQSLPIGSTDTRFGIIDNSEGDEGNECTKSQVAAAKAKGWTPLYYNGSKWVEYEGSEDPSPSIGSGTENDPFSPAAANEFASSLGADIPTEQVYYVKGKVVSVKEQFGTQYGNATFYISDDGTTANQFYIYKAKYLGNKKYAGEDLKLNVGDEVVVCGKLVNYIGTLPGTVQEEAYVVSINGTKGSTHERGDVNGDGVVNIADLMMLVNILTGK